MTFESFRTNLYRSRDKTVAFRNLKYDFPDFQKLTAVLTRVENEMPGFRGLLNKLLFSNNPFPNSYQSLHNEGKIYSTDFRIEINWETAAILRHSEKINCFLSLQKQFDHNLLSAEYENCRTILAKIESEVCFSYWTLENRYILDEYQFGSEKNWETRNEIVDRQNDIYVRAFGDLFSLKAERKMSLFKYNEETIRWEESVGIKNSSEYQHIREYFRFKSNHFLNDRYHCLSEILSLERGASIVDRYLMSKRIAQHLLVYSLPELPHVVGLIEAMSKEIDDIELKQILLIQGKQTIQKGDFPEVMRVIDEYTVGNYTESQRAATLLLQSNQADNIDLIEICAKSAIEGNLENIDITSGYSLANEIKNSFFEILLKGTHNDDAILKLLKISAVFNNSHIGIKIYAFICRELGWKTETDYTYLSHISSRFFNIRALENIYNESTASVFISLFTAGYPDSTTVQLFNAFYAGYHSDEFSISELQLPLQKKLIYRIRLLVQKEYYSIAIETCEKALSDHALSPIIEYEVVSSLYAAYIKVDDYRNALIVYVNAYLKNQHLVKRCDTDFVVEAITKNKFKNIFEKDSLIDLPLFFKKTSKEHNRIKQAYEQFIIANKFSKPSQLLHVKDRFDKLKLVYFLRNVCVPEILQLSKYLTSSEMVNEERILVCQFLAEHDTSNTESYNNEIASTTQKNIISKVLGHFDERKIYVNDEKIKALLIRNEKPSTNPKEQALFLNRDLFDRYTKLIDYLNDQNEYKDDGLLLFPDNSEKKAQSEFEKEALALLGAFNAAMHRPTLRMFELFFHSIRELFLFNNEYGLDAYLSSKIRHGTLPNHLRSVFENYELVTSQAQGVYLENRHWNSNLTLSEDKMSNVQSALADFSRKVDDISKRLKDEWIQCRTEKRNNNIQALFDFSYKNKDILMLFIKQFKMTKSYNLFVENSLTELWERTERCLADIRQKIETDLKIEFNSIISQLEDDLLRVVERHDVHELLHNINKSRTEIQTKLGNIANWFRRSEGSFDGYYTLQTLVDTSIQIIKNINPTYKFAVERSGCLEIPIKGEHHQHVIDVLANFFQNMIEHPKIDSESLKASVSFSLDDSRLTGIFENCISDKVSVADLDHKLSTIRQNWEMQDNNVRLEKNSGIPKIKRILRSDLVRTESQFDYDVMPGKLRILLSFETTGLFYEHIDN